MKNIFTVLTSEENNYQQSDCESQYDCSFFLNTTSNKRQRLDSLSGSPIRYVHLTVSNTVKEETNLYFMKQDYQQNQPYHNIILSPRNMFKQSSDPAKQFRPSSLLDFKTLDVPQTQNLEYCQQQKNQIFQQVELNAQNNNNQQQQVVQNPQNQHNNESSQQDINELTNENTSEPSMQKIQQSKDEKQLIEIIKKLKSGNQSNITGHIKELELKFDAVIAVKKIKIIDSTSDNSKKTKKLNTRRGPCMQDLNEYEKDSQNVMNQYKSKIVKLNAIQKEIRTYRQQKKKQLGQNDDLLRGFNLIIKEIVALLRQYRNVITARQSRLKKKHEPIDLDNQVQVLKKICIQDIPQIISQVLINKPELNLQIERRIQNLIQQNKQFFDQKVTVPNKRNSKQIAKSQ